jgi:ribosome-binding protein aMBF1 (putative translation factor)
MNKKKQKRLEAKGWALGSAAELLGLGTEENLLVELRADFARAIRARRAELGWSQGALAQRMGSTQAKVSDAEHGVGSVEMMVRALAAMGIGRKELAAIVR